MYSVSEDYLEAMQEPVVRYRLRGTVGNINVTEENFVSNTVAISSKCAEGSDIKIGSVYVGQLTATIRNVVIARGGWQGLTVSLSEGLYLGEDENEQEIWEDVPLGVFYVDSADHTKDGVKIKAYDGMSLLDKPFTIDVTEGSLWNFLQLIKMRFNLTLAITQQEFEALPNGQLICSISEENDIETWRDFLSWIAQSVGCIATFDRLGRLALKPYTMTEVDSVDEYRRFSGCSFSDYTTKYSGISVVNIAERRTEYINIEGEEDIYLTYNLGSNPLIQGALNVAPERLLQAISTLELVPFTATMQAIAPYDLGDCLEFTGGLAGVGVKSAVMSIDYKYGRGTTIKGYGANPALSSARSKSDKTLAFLESTQNIDGMGITAFMLAQKKVLAPNQRTQLMRIAFATQKTTTAGLHLELLPIVQLLEQSTGCKLKFEYQINADLLTGYTPIDTYDAGNHIIDLTTTFGVEPNAVNNLRIYCTAEGGSAIIDVGQLQGYILARGLVSDIPWDGYIDAEDEAVVITIPTLEVVDADDDVEIVQITPITITASDTAEVIAIPTITVVDNIGNEYVTNGDWLIEMLWGDVKLYNWGAIFDNYVWGTTI